MVDTDYGIFDPDVPEVRFDHALTSPKTGSEEQGDDTIASQVATDSVTGSKQVEDYEPEKIIKWSHMRQISGELFNPHACWDKETRTVPTLARARSNISELRSNTSGQWKEAPLAVSRMEKVWNRLVRPPMIQNPSTTSRLCWDVIGICLICYDIIMLPLGVFEPDTTILFALFTWITRIFWTADMFASFLVGFYEGGVLVLRPWMIAKRYMTSWFAFDIALVTIDWAQLGLPEEDEDDGLESLGLARMGKTVRVMRLLRILRLLRLMKLPKLFMLIEERIQSESVTVAISITRLTVSILIINHFIACLWYSIGLMHEQDDTWLVRYGAKDASFGKKYTMSLHWTLTQFTPSTMEVFPQNLTERTFALIVVVFAMITFSSFISSITTAMNQLRNMNSENAKALLAFQRYVRHHKITPALAVRMRRHLAKKLLRGKGHVDEKDIELIQQLSPPLLMDLHAEIYLPEMTGHAFFREYQEDNAVVMRKLCHVAASETSVSAGDVVFACGEIATKMFFMKSGLLRYTRGEYEGDVIFVKTSDWLSEACLWTQWRHLGHSQAISSCLLINLDAQQFIDIVGGAGFVGKFNPACYARLFVNHLNNMDPADVGDDHDYNFDLEKACRSSTTNQENQQEQQQQLQRLGLHQSVDSLERQSANSQEWIGGQSANSLDWNGGEPFSPGGETFSPGSQVSRDAGVAVVGEQPSNTSSSYDNQYAECECMAI